MNTRSSHTAQLPVTPGREVEVKGFTARRESGGGLSINDGTGEVEIKERGA